MPYRLGNKNVNQKDFLAFLLESRQQMTDACTYGARVLIDMGASRGNAELFAQAVNVILCSGLDMEIEHVSAESTELNSPVDLKRFAALQELIQKLESDIKFLTESEATAMPEVKPGIRGMLMMFENQLHTMKEERNWMQEQLEKFESDSPTLAGQGSEERP